MVKNRTELWDLFLAPSLGVVEQLGNWNTHGGVLRFNHRVVAFKSPQSKLALVTYTLSDLNHEYPTLNAINKAQAYIKQHAKKNHLTLIGKG
jgi:hypothetical protein